MEPYRVRLKDFEGSLDLLLHLVRSAKMDICSIHLSEITDEYLRYMEQIHEIDMDRASDFLETASILVLIKSRSLLPQPPKQEENDDPEMELKERLQLYEVFQSASRTFKNKEEEGQNYFYRLAPSVELEPEPEMESEEPPGDLDVRDLLRAYVDILAKKRKSRQPIQEHPVHVVKPQLFSVRRQKVHILEMLEKCSSMTFDDLFPDRADVQELTVTFSAMLELWGAGQILLRQDRPFSTIEVRLFDMELPA